MRHGTNWHPEHVIRFWVEEVGPGGWYNGSDALDAEIRARFAAPWRAARAGGLDRWQATPRGALAFCILTDQFPRNMFRGEGRAFSTDRLARGAARAAIDAGFDRSTGTPERQFFYLPFEHSERMADQDYALHLILRRMNDSELALHARAHRSIIRRFGRFPFRNDALGRGTSTAERAWLEAGGYGAEVRHLRGA
ncbi:hypothetical protein JSE7799_02767 [Jannaschia seosinensis]|uniref:DUF924 domain-containing protein n=1 Tax=Jannaschia seosinensis TaxID=313367 RepID=A0A0M7BD90_9RHOB|nr:DUF924 family protein [Jannaschia seosinensis]CUH40038.1 hypothetical protein JSE7799_02767 [Jannaschia seosinensis]